MSAGPSILSYAAASSPSSKQKGHLAASGRAAKPLQLRGDWLHRALSAAVQQPAERSRQGRTPRAGDEVREPPRRHLPRPGRSDHHTGSRGHRRPGSRGQGADRTGLRRLARRVLPTHAAVDSLFQAEAWESLNPAGLELFDACAEQKQWPVADSVAHMLASAMQKSGNTDQTYEAEVMKRFTLAHQHVGGHGHGH